MQKRWDQKLSSYGISQDDSDDEYEENLNGSFEK